MRTRNNATRSIFRMSRPLPLHPVGLFKAKITGAKMQPTDNKIRMGWTVETGLQEDGQPIGLIYWTGATFHPESNLNRLISATGIEPPTDDEEAEAFSPSCLIGRECNIVVGHRENGPYQNAYIMDVFPIGEE